MEALLGFAAGWLLSWPALIGLILLGIIFEANSAHGWAAFTGLSVAAIAFFFFNIPLMTLALYGAGYLAVGFVWSWWRYKRYADKVVEFNRDKPVEYRKAALRDLHPKQMLGKLTTWVLVWPFSMVENIAGDAIKIIQMAISKLFRGIYHRIYNGAVASLGLNELAD